MSNTITFKNEGSANYVNFSDLDEDQEMEINMFVKDCGHGDDTVTIYLSRLQMISLRNHIDNQLSRI